MFYLTKMSSGAAVLTVNTSSGTCPYETKESPGEPSLSQKDASHKTPIQQLSGFFLGVLSQSNDNDAQRSIPELQRKRIFIIFKFGGFGF